MADVCLMLYPIELGGLEMVWEQTIEEIETEEREQRKGTRGWPWLERGRVASENAGNPRMTRDWRGRASRSGGE